MSTYTEVPLNDTAVPVPAAYTRHLSYNAVNEEYHDPIVFVASKRDTVQTIATTEAESLKPKDEEDKDQEVSTGKEKKSLLIFLRDSRIYIRVLAILIMIVSFSLILTAVIMWGKAQNKPSINNIPKPATITDHPCIVFTGVAAMNLCISITVLSLSCLSSKFKKTDNAINAVFAIISAIGFATSMGACFFLNKQTTLQNDLWKWSCGNHQKGIVSDVIDFQVVCHVVSYGWKFGLVQASLELLTFIVSVTAFVLLKYSYFARYGRMGKVF
jgi:hypothetical protein